MTLVTQSYEGDSFAQELITKLALDPSALPAYTLHSGVLRYRNRIWIGNSTSIQTRLISAFHDSAMGGILAFQLPI